MTIDDIINEPPVNVAPIQYGQWILRGRKILCSKCKAVFEELKEEELFEVKADCHTYVRLRSSVLTVEQE